MDGSLRVQLLSLTDMSMGKRTRWTGNVQVAVQCETLAALTHTQTSQVVKITWGYGEFHGQQEQTVRTVSTSVPSRGFDIIIRKVPTSGVLTLKLLKVNALGSWVVAKAYLQLDKVQHQLHGGHEIEHVLTWQPMRGTWTWGGEVTLHAFWMSTEQECLEMELMTLRVRCLLVMSVVNRLCMWQVGTWVQAEVHQKRELLAQLIAKYGDDVNLDSTNASESEDKVFDWRQTGNLVVDVMEGLMPLVQQRMGIRFKVKITLHGKQGSEVFKSTCWASGIKPSWHERLKFQHSSRHDVMILQVLFINFRKVEGLSMRCRNRIVDSKNCLEVITSIQTGSFSQKHGPADF